MDETEVEQAVLRALVAWGWLPETDLVRRLAPAQVVRYRRAMLERLTATGLITVRQIGDEPVVALTEAGRRAVAGTEQPL